MNFSKLFSQKIYLETCASESCWIKYGKACWRGTRSRWKSSGPGCSKLLGSLLKSLLWRSDCKTWWWSCLRLSRPWCKGSKCTGCAWPLLWSAWPLLKYWSGLTLELLWYSIAESSKGCRSVSCLRLWPTSLNWLRPSNSLYATNWTGLILWYWTKPEL